VRRRRGNSSTKTGIRSDLVHDRARTSEDRGVLVFHYTLVWILVLSCGMSTKSNMVMDQPDDAESKRQKLGPTTSSDDAKAFLIEVLGQGTEVDLSKVPADATVQSIEDILSEEPSRVGKDNSWFDNFQWKTMCAIQHALSNRKSREQVLHSKGIMFYGSADRERSIQESITSPIGCKTARSSLGPRQDNVSLVLGPSGSGKTTYCVKEHGKSASHSGDDGTPIKKVFRVYMYASDLGSSNRKEVLKGILLKNIRDALSLDGAVDVPKLTMTLYAIIDEAGCDEFFGQEKNLLDLTGAVKDIATDVQLWCRELASTS
jgi:hypothetical protein